MRSVIDGTEEGRELRQEGPWGRRGWASTTLGRGKQVCTWQGAGEEEEGRDSFWDGQQGAQNNLRQVGQAKPLPATALGLPAQPSLDVSTGSRQRTERMEGSPQRLGQSRAHSMCRTLACLVLEETDTPRPQRRDAYKRAYCVLGTPPACPHAIGTDSGNNITTPPRLITAESILLPLPHPVGHKSLADVRTV